MSFAFDHIRDTGFESSLSQLIAYAEMQARLNQSLNDRDRHLFWVRSWAQLQRASDAIAALRDFQSSSPWTESAQKLLPLKKEERQLARLEDRYQKAQRALTVADGKLRAAKEQNPIERNLSAPLNRANYWP